MKHFLVLGIVFALFANSYSQTVNNQYNSWSNQDSFFIITTPDGANLEEGKLVRDFPVLFRINSDFFDFDEASADGSDIRFSLSNGQTLNYLIEEWNPVKGSASIWIKIPEIRGNTKQEITFYWGNERAKSESKGSEVFNQSNGFISVFNFSVPIIDEVGSVSCKDSGSIPVNGIIGKARGFSNGTHIDCGDNITSYPSGSEARTTSAWIKATSSGWAVDWGMEARCQENSIKLEKPPVLKNEGYLCDVWGNTELEFNKWHYAAISYKDENLIVYLDGKEDGRSIRNFVTPDTSYLRIGKRHNSPDSPWGRQWWNGAIDELRISNVARSPEWIYLEYENQKEMQTLVGPLVKPGDYFTVSDREFFVNEGEDIEILAEASGAQKVYWIHKKNNVEEILAVDKLILKHNIGRTAKDVIETFIFRGIYPDEIKEIEIPVSIYDAIPDPDYELQAPVNWDGRETIVVEAIIGNMEQMEDAGASKLNYEWDVSNIAVSKEISGDKLILKRAQKSGIMLVNLKLDNGGDYTSRTIAVNVVEPLHEPWIKRLPGEDEKPVNHQFYARDDENYGTIFYSGRSKEAADSVMLRIYADDELYLEKVQKTGKKRSFSIEARIEAGLVKYTLELWAIKPKDKKLLEKIVDIVCGDVYIINGQSNAEAYDYGKAVNSYSSTWVRSFGSSSPDPEKALLDKWGKAVSFDKGEAELQIGYWGIELAKNIVMKYEVPVCIINGAKGGSRIDQHLKNHDNPEDLTTIYGRLLRRIKQAGLTHGIRGIIWHQGENDQGAAGPDGFGWENYQRYFTELSADWIEDYPNIKNYYIFQIWPDACSMGRNGSGDRLREAQRTLPDLFSNMSVMSTLGIRPGGGCHFPPEGYKEMADLILPLIERDNYGFSPDKSITPPNLLTAYFTNQRRDEIALEFDQAMDWDNNLVSQFYLDGENGVVSSGSLWGSKIILKLNERSEASEISYIDGKNWDQNNILYGQNDIAALTFYEVPLRSLNSPSLDVGKVMGRSPAPQPYPYLSRGYSNGDPIPESPDPLVSYKWPDPAAEDGLEIFVLSPESVDSDSPESFEGLSSLTGDEPLVTVLGTGSIRIDFGLEMPAWIEFDSPDYPGGALMSISEYNQPGINKTKKPVKYGNTYRLELNDELYEGVRFAWIHVEDYTEKWHITSIRAVNQVKPTNYRGSFSCSNQLLTKIWYMSAYSVKASMCEDYFGAILMDRGDRMSWTGDAHPIQAASLVAFANYDFVKKNIENTADQNNGIKSYSLYWVLSLLDYYKYTGDKATLLNYLNNAGNKLDDAYLEFGDDPDLRFYGWDERLTAGFELWFKPAPEAQKAYKMLTIRAWQEFAEVMKEIGREDLESKYSWWARRKIAELRNGRDWIKEYGLHSATEAINTGLLTQREIDSIYINLLVNRENRLSLSPFNQYFIIQSFAEIDKYDDAISTILDIWGGMIKNGATTTYEVFRPSWNDFLEPNDPVPNSQSGIVSLCHPWGAGPVKWINEEVLGIKPASPGFKDWAIIPHPGRRLDWMQGSTPTPFGDISVDMDLSEGRMSIKTPPGTNGKFGIPRLGRVITKITINGDLAWDGEYHQVPGIEGSSSDSEFVYFDGVQAGNYEVKYEFSGSTPFYVEPHYQYIADYHGLDSTTGGNWGGEYGKDGYVLINYWGKGMDEQSLPDYVDSISYFRAFPRTPDNKPDFVIWEKNTFDERALSPDRENNSSRSASCMSNDEQTMTFTAHIEGKKNFNIALYFLDWENKGISQAVEMFDAETLNLIAPVKMVDDFQGGKYLIFGYNQSVKFRINKIRGENICLSGIFFDPVKND